jgi:hypothetical protein
MVNGVPTVLNKMPGFNHNRNKKSHNRLKMAGRWVPTPDYYVKKMQKLGLRITTTRKQKNPFWTAPYCPS